MKIRHILAFLLTVTSIESFIADVCGQDLYYRYWDEDGNQVYTNIPPVQPVYDLQISGTMPAVQMPPTTEKPSSYDAIIEKYANHYNVDASLIRSIIATESGFNPRAVSPKGARGLMQLMPATAKRLGVADSFDPEENIRGGVKHFRSLMDNFNNDLTLSLAAYNAGENLVQRLGRVPDIKETQNYVRSITNRLEKQNLDEPVQDAPEHPPTYKFVDESGVLHLTNIPPSGLGRD